VVYPFTLVYKGVGLWTVLKKECLVVYNKKGKVKAVYQPGSEEHWRVQRVLEILHEADKRYLKKLLDEKKEKEEHVSKILDGPDKKIIYKAKKGNTKKYNLTQAAKILDVTRQGLYYWIKKGWIKPKRDFRNYPFFTVFDTCLQFYKALK